MLISRSLILLCCLTLGACVSIPEQSVLTSGSGANRVEAEGDCVSNRLLETDQANQPRTGLAPGRIEILVWNIYKGQRDGWHQDLEALSRNKHILVLQEAALEGQIEALMNDSGLHWQHGTAFRRLQVKNGVMTAAVTPSVSHCMYRVDEPFIGIPKTVLITRYPLLHRHSRLLVINIHGINFELDQRGYEEQLEHLRQLVDTHDGPVIVAGDFNTWSRSRMEYVDKLARSVSLRALDLPDQNRTRILGQHLDLVFFRGLRLIDARAVPVSSSDHNPIIVSFALDE